MIVLAMIPLVNSSDISVDYSLGSPQTLTVSATISSSVLDVGEIQLCDGTCAFTKTIDPATQFTVKVTMNNDSDINTSGFDVYFYQTTDTNSCSADWDCIRKFAVTSGSADGCEATGSVYCLTVSPSNWTTKFIAGSGDIWVRAEKNSGEVDFNESVGALEVSNAISLVLDTTTATYSLVPNTTQNTITTDQANPYIAITHSGNISLDLNTIGADFISGGDTIDKANQKYNVDDNYAGATSIDGTPQVFLIDMNRGIYPTSSLRNLWLWLDCPDQQPTGTYTSSLTIGAEAS